MDLLQCLYRPSTQNNLDYSFNKLTTSLSQANEIYDSFMGICNLNIDVNLSSHEHGKLEKRSNFLVS